MTPKPEPRRALLYARVSSANGSTIEQQLDALRQLCRQRGWTVAAEYTDHGVSGAKEKRPGLDRLMADARAKRCDVVCIWKFDRFARSTAHLFNALKEFNDLRIAFVSLTENVDTTTAYGRAVFGILAVVAALERELTSERLRAKWAYKKEKEGKVPGPRPRIKITVAEIERRRKAESYVQIARDLGCTPQLLWNRVNKAKVQPNT
jgi:DNA invertase Pin-like site-specific DNA recombinase